MYVSETKQKQEHDCRIDGITISSAATKRPPISIFFDTIMKLNICNEITKVLSNSFFLKKNLFIYFFVGTQKLW